ncbi:MAG TPA: 2-amino-4-hydroxy-6-hydroxymethyldihydropteridine diphosphokinase [Steroidobacteraceae bacterium]|nr:2-amino-4-hydroxy-6-hydroxymethyldihydropteridine diphosphokinase [Steroidobacteraceae bacterium]
MGGVWQPAYIGLGSNLEDPRAQVSRALERLGTLEGVYLALCSPLYGSRPLGRADQPDFVNAVAGVLTELEPLALLHTLRELERSFGRPAARERWGPRILDLDLLVHGRERRADAELTLPHPGLAQRSFVLYPLAEIAPDLDVPGLGRVSALKARVAAEAVWRLDDRRAA